MKLKITALLLSVILSTSVFAHGNEKHDGDMAAMMKPGRDASKAVLTVAPAAKDAVAAVDRFSDALTQGDMAKLAAELDKNVLVLESGGAQRTAAEYLGEHAKSDAAFMKTAHVMLMRRTALVDGNLAYVASESEIHTMKGEAMLAIASTETMVLKRVGAAWKIVHIHWSSRKK